MGRITPRGGGYWVIPNYYAPKWHSSLFNPTCNLHAIAFNRCDFRCGYCNFSNRRLDEYQQFSSEDFEDLIDNLLKLGPYFKFTGGEPTLNRSLFDDLSIVKQKGGTVFLDTNGSRPEVLYQLFDNGLVDVMGLSLKGITREDAMSTANVSDGDLCWNKVFDSLRIATEAHIATIVTIVIHSEIDPANIEIAGAMLPNKPTVHLKVNNLLTDEFQAGQYKRTSPDILQASIESFIEKNPEWRGRVTLVNSNEAVRASRAVMFF